MKSVFFIQKPEIPDDMLYGSVPHILWTADLSLEDKAMVAYLLSHKDNFPLNNTFIAKGLNVSRKFVIDSLKRLQEKKIIEKKNRKLTIFLSNIKCNPKLQLTVTQSNTNKMNKQNEKNKQNDLETVTQSDTSQKLHNTQSDSLVSGFNIPIGRELTEEERKELSDSLPF